MVHYSVLLGLMQFFEYGFLEANDVFSSVDAAMHLNESIANSSIEEVRELLERASIEPMQIVQEALQEEDSPHPMFALLYSNAFFLTPGRIVIVYHERTSSPPNIIINLNDISDFLRVEKW